MPEHAGTILISAGLFSFAFRVAQPNLRDATKRLTPVVNNIGHALLAATVLLFVIEKSFRTIGSEEVFALIPLWALIQVFITAYASGSERHKQPWL